MVGDHVLGQILGQALSARRHVSRLKMGHEAFGVVFPAPVDVLLDARIVHLLPEQVEQMVLPFLVHHLVGNKGHVLPVSLSGQSTGGDEDM